MPAENQPENEDSTEEQNPGQEGVYRKRRKKRHPHPRTSIPARKRRTQEPPVGVTR